MTFQLGCDEKTFQPGVLMYDQFIEQELIQDLKCIMGHDFRELLYGILKDKGVIVEYTQFLGDIAIFETKYQRYL